MKSVIAFFVQRPLIVNLMMAMVFIAGFNSIQTASVRSSSGEDFGVFTITTIRAGASPEKMELSITVPLEEEILKVENTKRVISNSMEGVSIIQVSANSKASQQQLLGIESNIQKAIDRATARLPADIIEKPLLNAIGDSDWPLMSLMISGTASEEVLRSVTRNLQNQLREVSGVASVERKGYRDREVRVMLDPQKLSRLGLSYEEIENAIRSRNVTETGGSLEAFIGEQDVVAIGEFAEPKDVASVIIRASEKGNYLRLRDVAEVVMDYEDAQNSFFMRNAAGIMLDVMVETRVNELEVAARVEQVMEQFKATLPANVTLDMVLDNTDFAQVVLQSLLSNAMIGACLIALALLVFFPWRAMVWVVAGIPIAVLLGLVIMQLLNIEITITAMVAMILVLGLLVDDAIVSSESIYRYYERGMSPRQAAIAGINDVAKPVFTGAFTTVIAMMPLLLVGGVDAKFLWVVPATVILMIISSLFECMLLLPSHIAESLHRGPRKKPKALWFKHIEQTYRQWLNYYLARPFLALFFLLLTMVLGVMLLNRFMIFESYPDVDTDTIYITAVLPTGASMASTEQAMAEVEARIQASEWSQYIQQSYVVAGNHDTGQLDYLIEGQQQNWGKVVVQLTPFNKRSADASTIASSFEQAVAGLNNFTSINVVPIDPKPPIGKPVELQLIFDSDDREVIAEELLVFLRQHPSVTRAWSSYSPGKSLLELKLHYEKLADYGLKVADVTKALRVAYDGMLVEELQTREELIRYRLQLQDKYRQDMSSLRSLNVISPRGEAIPLRNIADFEIQQGQSSILHYAGLRTETVFAEIDRGQITPQAINDQLASYIQAQDYYQRYPGVRFRFGGELEAQAESADGMLTGLILVLASIFFLMVILFNSLSLPIATLMLVPVSFVAVLTIFVIQGVTVSFIALVGLLGLIGVLVNGALVMIDLVRKLHLARGSNSPVIAIDDIVDGAIQRLRPLLITAITTLVGLGPAAFGVAGTHPTTEALLLVMFWGVAVGALVTLFTLPLFLVLDSRCKQWLIAIRN